MKRKKFIYKRNRPCRICGVKLTSKNQQSCSYMCKRCNRKYRVELGERKIIKNRQEFLLNNPNVKLVNGFNDRYLVSDKGDIFRVTVEGTKQLVPIRDKYGYFSISLYVDGKRKTMKVHRIVALAWIPNPYPYVNKIINHKDGVKWNNHYTNLEWCTYKQNSVHAVKTGLSPKGEEIKHHKLTEEQVKEIYALKGHITQKELMKIYGISLRLVVLIQNNKVWKHVKKERMRRTKLLLNRKKKDGSYVKEPSNAMKILEEYRAREEKKKEQRLKNNVNKEETRVDNSGMEESIN